MDMNVFREPPADCRAAPFWSWNGDLSVEETRGQVRDLAEHGFGGGFMHSRPGLLTEYLGEQWFANCRAAIEEGKQALHTSGGQAGFYCWLYDEDRWPSGTCGGRTAAGYADFRSRHLVMQRGDEALAWAGRPYAALDCLARYRMPRTPGQEPQLLPANAAEPELLTFYSATFPTAGSSNGDYYPDLLHDEAMREFIRNTYEPYAARFQADFGKSVPGIFTDEPGVHGVYPWSVRLAGEFRRRRGYDLIGKLPALFLDAPDAPRVRHDYWKTVRELFRESFMAPLGKWCGDHGFAFTGHLLMEGTLGGQIRTCGGTMWHYLPMHLPGIDILREEIVEIGTCKQVASVCNQFEKPLMLSELYGCTGYNFSFEGQKWIGDWQMALGVNFLCPHLSLYTMKGCAKRDYPPSYSYQSPWWRHYRHIADYQARLSYFLRQGRAVRDILVIHPLSGAWCKYGPGPGDGGPAMVEENRRFAQLMENLAGLHRDFDLGDEMILAEHGSTRGTDLAVGAARYPLVIVAPTCNLESPTLDLLEKFAQAGGKLLFAGEIASLVDGAPSTRASKLAYAEGVQRAAVHRKELEEALDALLPRKLSVVLAETGAEAPKVLCQQREAAGRHILFLANTDRENGARLKVRLPVSGAWENWDCETGEVAPLPSSATAAGSEVELFLPPAGSAALVLDPQKPASAAPRPPRIRQRGKVLNPRGVWSFRRLEANSLVLDRCSYRIGEEAFSREMFLMDAQDDWRARFKLFSVRTMNGGTQPWKLIQDPANLKPLAPLATRYRLHARALPANEVFLVLEDRADFEIFVNGSLVAAPAAGWFMDRSFEKVPIGGLLRRGENVVELRTTLTAMRLVEDIYVIGDFGVNEKDFALEREPKRLRAGDWRPQGYPFYTDGMMYEARFRVPEKFQGRVFVELSRFEGTVAAVWVNGAKAAVIGWRPYRADITKFARPGGNEIGIEVVGSPRNLMGPRHSREKYPGWIGPKEMSSTEEPACHITPAGLTGEVRMVFATGQ